MAGSHRAVPAARSRGSARVRYDKAVALAASVGVTGFAVVTGFGQVLAPTAQDQTATVRPRVAPAVDAGATRGAATAGLAESAARSLPGDSGRGRRVVFDQSAQRVWLVGSGDRVLRTYLVSGSVSDNLRPGHYAVYSRSLHAVGIADSGTMDYFVRFTRGENAAIGFHDIPVDDGQKVQTTAELGQPTSHGCIRQRTVDAKQMWRFADLGTTVDVVA